MTIKKILKLVNKEFHEELAKQLNAAKEKWLNMSDDEHEEYYFGTGTYGFIDENFDFFKMQNEKNDISFFADNNRYELDDNNNDYDAETKFKFYDYVNKYVCD